MKRFEEEVAAVVEGSVKVVAVEEARAAVEEAVVATVAVGLRK
jgi:hypothetical protein